jgi:hypothetical protein
MPTSVPLSKVLTASKCSNKSPIISDNNKKMKPMPVINRNKTIKFRLAKNSFTGKLREIKNKNQSVQKITRK